MHYIHSLPQEDLHKLIFFIVYLAYTHYDFTEIGQNVLAFMWNIKQIKL